MSRRADAALGERIRVALFATHPVQYHVPWFQALAARPELALRVFFGQVPDARQQGVGFGVDFHWDIPLMAGYESEVLENVARPPSLGNFAGCDTPRVAERLRHWKPDLAILTGWQSKMLVQAWWACARLGVPRIVRGESNALSDRASWKRLAHRVWLRGFDRFLAIGKSNRDFYVQAGIPESRIHPCPYFVDNERFAAAAAPLRERRAELRARWSIPERATCFLFCGKLIPKKHPLDLLRALERAVAAGASAHVLVVGDGELMAQARALAERERLPVTFAGFLNQTEIAGAYVAADCLVLPSDTGETWGLVVNEAMACGIPAIVSDQVGCGPDLVSEGVTGATFPTGRCRRAGAAPDRSVLRSRQVARDGRCGARPRHVALFGGTRRRGDDGGDRRVDWRAGSRPMRLLHVVPTYFPAVRYGGPIHSVHGLCAALAARGHDVHVFTTNVDGPGDSVVPLGKPVSMDGVNVWYFPSPPSAPPVLVAADGADAGAGSRRLRSRAPAFGLPVADVGGGARGAAPSASRTCCRRAACW